MDESKLQELLHGGLTHAEAAKQLGCSRAAVSYAAKKLGISPNSARKPIDIGLLRQAVASGCSFSEFARQHGHTLPAISKVAKKHGIDPPGIGHLRKVLDDSELYSEYESGTSLNSLSKRHNVPVALIKRHLIAHKHDLKVRTHDESVRPALLNDAEQLESVLAEKSCRQVATDLGVKLATVTAAAKRLGLRLPFVKRWDLISQEELFVLYQEQMLPPATIALKLGYPYGVIMRQLRRFGFPIKKAGGFVGQSKYAELNDKEWMFQRYINEEKSANEIALLLSGKPSVSMVLYHLRKHGIPVRTKIEYMHLLMSHGTKHTVNGLKCDSNLEVQYLKWVGSNSDIKRGPVLKAADSVCSIDFVVDGTHVEVKPKSVIAESGPDRRRTVKQLLVSRKNNIDLKLWTPNGYFDISLNDDDIYHAMNWKLFFSSSAECADWLINYGFQSPKYAKLDLADAAIRMSHCEVGYELNANYPNVYVGKMTHHFFPHFWRSTHKNYLPVPAAWDLGNRTILSTAVAALWERSQEINIYGLLKHINKFFKDFATVSLFKPWVAAYIYDKYLPNGGAVVDPSCGWGGRLMAVADRDIRYIGYDLNPNAVQSHAALNDFLGSRMKHKNEFHVADSSVIKFADGDLLFTSPPYDDTELYHGINSYATKTGPIYDNIFRQFKGVVVLNIPKRHEELCCDVAKRYGRALTERLEMKTSSFMGRTKTHEPILVFGK